MTRLTILALVMLGALCASCTSTTAPDPSTPGMFLPPSRCRDCGTPWVPIDSSGTMPGGPAPTLMRGMLTGGAH